MSIYSFSYFHKIKKLPCNLFSLVMGKTGQVGTNNESYREDWIRQILAIIPEGSRILDAGAGELKYKSFCGHLNYVSQDFAKYDGKGNGIGLQTGMWDRSKLDIISDITQIPEPDASFDAVMCVEVLEHLPYPVDALRELVRLLKPGGALIVTAPFCSLTHFSPYFYFTGFSYHFYEYWLNHLGLEIVDIKWNGNYFEYLAQELRRLPYAGEKYAGITLTWFEQNIIRFVLRSLHRLSQHNSMSEELLSFGLHIRAIKK